MAQRITDQDLETMLARYTRACERHGLVASGDQVWMDHGSQMYGRAFRVYTIREGSTAHHNPPAGNDFLGMTKREAFHSLAERSSALEAVRT
tara:strand:- start:271 stop:546 length:276 start_codon:yes stop_codon:yes gene_type:complete